MRALAQEPTMISDLRDLQWQHRILVLNEPHNPEALFERLSTNAAAFDERRLIWFVLHGGTVQTNYPETPGDELSTNIRSQLNAGLNEALLIGLDGGVKARGNRLDLEALYAMIDAMPMRRAEQRE
ncbi:MAG: hypothetical protein ACI8RN_000060 [Glaciecola sp.]|jgi:hypothetical protein